MFYNEIQPSTNLCLFVKCFWVLEDDGDQQLEKQRIIPDGCMEMIFHYGDLYKQYTSNDDFIIQPRCFVFGQINSPLDIQPTGKTGILGVRFFPDGFIPFAALPLSRMKDKAISLEALYGNQGIALEKKILGLHNNSERITTCEQFLNQKLSDQKNIDRIIKESVEIILAEQGKLTVATLSEKTKTQRRQLERKFASIVGLSPKQLAKVIRLKTTIKKLLESEYSSLTELAYEGEYFDQAHFIKDFKEFTGQTPKKFYSESLKMSSLFHQKE